MQFHPSILIKLLSLLAVTLACFATFSPVSAHSQSHGRPSLSNPSYFAGVNYIPRSAGNQLEMWQSETWNPKQIDQELRILSHSGLTALRVFLHDLLWTYDQDGFIQRIDKFLSIADSHGLSVLFVLFDSCWEASPHLGPQHPPIPGVHNSAWMQSPGIPSLLNLASNTTEVTRLHSYITGVISHYASDERIIGWDVWNEPGNSYNSTVYDVVVNYLPQVFEWARSVNATQPLTSPIWSGPLSQWSDPNQLDPVQKIQLHQSDVISFHNYAFVEEFQQRHAVLKQYGKPIFCSEYMARSAGSWFDTHIPAAYEIGMGVFSWGAFNGRTQTHLPWSTWQIPAVLFQPTIWFHDLYYPDGTPYRAHEIEILQKYANMSASAS